MTDAILTHDAGVSAFEDAGGVVKTNDSEDGEVTFSWDEDNIVRVDAPANLEGAFDTDRFYKIEGATIARPIKQPYLVGDEIKWYKKPADELDRAAWSFDNAPFTLGHPDTGMVKNVDDIRGFWRNPRYDDNQERLKEDLYVPVGDDEAMEYIEEHGDVSVGFYNRVHSDYDGNTGDLTDDKNLDGFQVDMFGNHIAGVEQGRCSEEHGCGLDDAGHGKVVATDGGPTHTTMTENTTDAPSGIYVADDGTWLAVAPSEHSKDSTEHPDDAMFPVDSCSDVEDAWSLRGHTDNLDISKETLANRIERVDESKDCGVVPEESEDAAPELNLDEVEGYHPWKLSDTEDNCSCGDCPCDNGDSNMEEPDENADNGFDIPDLSVDAIVEQNDAVREIKEERDSLRENLDAMRNEIKEAFDSAENFSVELDEDESVAGAVDELVSDLDQKAEEVENLEDELSEYREDDIEEKLDRLEELGADREDWSETADEADDPLDALDEEIERREEVLDAAPETSVKDIDSSTDSGEDETNKTLSGTRTFGRGHNA